MDIYKINQKQRKELFFSLKGQFNSGSDMTQPELDTLWELEALFWYENKGRYLFGLKSSIKIRRENLKKMNKVETLLF